MLEFENLAKSLKNWKFLYKSWLHTVCPEWNRTLWVDVSIPCASNIHDLLTITQKVHLIFPTHYVYQLLCSQFTDLKRQIIVVTTDVQYKTTREGKGRFINLQWDYIGQGRIVLGCVRRTAEHRWCNTVPSESTILRNSVQTQLSRRGCKWCGWQERHLSNPKLKRHLVKERKNRDGLLITKINKYFVSKEMKKNQAIIFRSWKTIEKRYIG